MLTQVFNHCRSNRFTIGLLPIFFANKNLKRPLRNLNISTRERRNCLTNTGFNLSIRFRLSFDLRLSLL